MAGFNFERNLPHQQAAVDAIAGVFEGMRALTASEKAWNPIIEPENRYKENIMSVQFNNGIDIAKSKFHDYESNVLDISMETGTGKTYAYTKAMFELNRLFGISKFIVVVPTLSIKAGTVNFLTSASAKEHFRQDYKQELRVHVVESQKSSGKKKAKSTMPQAVREFAEANSPKIHVLVINAGMINSDTMIKRMDVALFDRYDSAMSAIASVKPFTIVDEPHKFSQTNVTWINIKKFQSQHILRFGATFTAYDNLIYRLTAVEAFNQDLVKGVVAYVEQFEDGKNIHVQLKSWDATDKTATQAIFELNDNGNKSKLKLTRDESLSCIHSELSGVSIDKIGKSGVVLSDGLELKRGDVINPYLYGETMQDKMLRQTVSRHFDIERDLLTRDVRIKPLTLFFINNIESYRDNGHGIGGTLKKSFEAMVKAEVKKRLKTESHPFYKSYLEKTLTDLSAVHGGYFSRDNSETSEQVAKEVDEILHDKEALLSINNTRRFIFSKWTLKEGWDNPNVFQICKLRSSGSEISKLQEVGRGLRLPVNEYMSRVKDEAFELHYHVDFTEADFVDRLVNEINEKSGVIAQALDKMTPELIERILGKYPVYDEESLLEKLFEEDIIKMSHAFKNDGYEKLMALFPDAFTGGMKKNKVRSAAAKYPKLSFRPGKYEELKVLWETINQKVILEYKVKSEKQFSNLLKAYFQEAKPYFKQQGATTSKKKISFENGKAVFHAEVSVHDEVLPVVTMSYKEFLLELADALTVNMNTLHQVFVEIQGEMDINHYLSMQTIRSLKGGFNNFLLDNAFSQFQIGYKKIASSIHPTPFTNTQGKAELSEELKSGRMGVHYDAGKTANNYLFNELFYDSDLERENISGNQKLKEVIVFTKIPKSSIRIPVAGGGTYSPDFAYVVEKKNGKKSLNFVVETKDKDKRSLFKDEEQKIKHAEALFNHLNPTVDIVFETQFKAQKIVDIIRNNL